MLEQAKEWARSNGYETAEEITLGNGETVYLLMSSGKVGLQRYIRYDGSMFIMSDDEESMALLKEPAYLGE